MVDFQRMLRGCSPGELEMAWNYGDDHVDVFETSSCYEGLTEDLRFHPRLEVRPLKHKSMDDMITYVRYFDHLQIEHRKDGRTFTWRHFMSVLKERIASFRAVAPLLKRKPRKDLAKFVDRFPSLGSPGNSAAVPAKLRRVAAGSSQGAKSVRFGVERSSSVESVSTAAACSTPVMSPRTQKGMLKKIYDETKTYARKICKTMEKISGSRAVCESCGLLLKGHSHEKCSSSSSRDLLAEVLLPKGSGEAPLPQVLAGGSRSEQTTQQGKQRTRARNPAVPRWRRRSPRFRKVDSVGDVSLSTSFRKRERRVVI